MFPIASQEGYASGYLGVAILNPYNTDNKAHNEWERGFELGIRDYYADGLDA